MSNWNGFAVMSVMESMFAVTKMMPEAALYPISRLIPGMDLPFVVETPGGCTYAVPTGTKIEATRTGVERFCSCLKKESLRMYVKNRLYGDTELMAINKIMTTMKDTEMFDGRSNHKGTQLIDEMTRLG